MHETQETRERMPNPVENRGRVCVKRVSQLSPRFQCTGLQLTGACRPQTLPAQKSQWAWAKNLARNMFCLAKCFAKILSFECVVRKGGHTGPTPGPVPGPASLQRQPSRRKAEMHTPGHLPPLTFISTVHALLRATPSPSLAPPIPSYCLSASLWPSDDSAYSTHLGCYLITRLSPGLHMGSAWEQVHRLANSGLPHSAEPAPWTCRASRTTSK